MMDVQNKHKMNAHRRPLMLLLTALAVFLAPSLAPADSIDALYQEASGEYRAAVAMPQREQKAQAIRQCQQHLQQLLDADIGERYADKTYYLMARCHHVLHDISSNSGDFKSALEKYRSVVSRYPQSPMADDALYLRGILLQGRDPAAAYLEFRKVELLYPTGDMRPKAKQKAEELGRKLGYAGAGQTGSEEREGTVKTREKGRPGESVPAAGTGSPPKADLSRLTDIRHWTGSDYTRVALYTNAPVQFKEKAIPSDPQRKQPGKIVVDLDNCRVRPGLKTKIPVMDAFLQDVRAEATSPQGTRIVLNTEAVDSYRVFSMSDPFRVIIDVRRKTGQEDAQPRDRASPPPAAPLPSVARQLGLNVKRIVLDPGHGGKDKGAISPNGVYEKNITLAIAKALKKVLETTTKCEVILTRTRDKFLSLEERTAIANARKADLFISIHTNAHEDRSLFGTETYFLNLAKDKESARVAAFENAVSSKNVSDLEAILQDLMLSTKINESAQLARQVQQHLISRLKVSYEGIKDLGTKQAPFYVLLGAEMPSILIETAFISNEREESRLKDKIFQEKLAKAISVGIQSYIQQMKGLARMGAAS